MMQSDRDATCDWDCGLEYPHEGPCSRGDGPSSTGLTHSDSLSQGMRNDGVTGRPKVTPNAVEPTSEAARPVKSRHMKTLSERIDDYMARKQLDRQTAIDTLLTFALDVIDGRRKGGKKVGNRPEQETHLRRARKAREK